MAALWFAVRAQLRAPRRLALTIGIAALVGVAGGAVLTAAAGARRTDTAYARLLEASNAPELVVRPVGGPDAVEPARIARLPQVAQSGEMRRYYFTIGTQGAAVDRPALFAAASVNGRALYTIGRPMVLDGRLPRPDRVNEVMVSRKVASDLGLEVGDELLGAIVQLGDSEAEQIRTQNVRLHVVGIGIGADEIGLERVSGFQTLLTPAFYDRYPDFSVDWNELVTLKPALAFSSGLTHLIRTPRLWGATWDVTANVAADERQLNGEFTLEETLIALQGLVERGLRTVDAVQGWSVATYQTISIDRRAVPAVGFERGGGVRLPLREGRLPRRANEVAFGASTLDDLGADVGGVVRDSNGRKLRVVGVVVLPQFAAIGGADEAGLGQGALFTLHGLLAAEPDPYTRAYLIRLKPGADVDATVQKILKATEPYAFNAGKPFRPSIIAEYDNDVEGRPAFLAAILGVLALGTLAHALITSVRRRRRDLAVLAALGFLRLQAAATVAWQATTVAVIGLLIGIPVGIMGGRFATSLLAREVGSISAPVTPWLPIVIVIVVTIFVANLLAAVPGWLATRVKPAVVLRSE